MLKVLFLLFTLLRAALRSRAYRLTENLALHHQLAILTGPPWSGRGSCDKLFGSSSAIRRDGRQHL